MGGRVVNPQCIKVQCDSMLKGISKVTEATDKINSTLDSFTSNGNLSGNWYVHACTHMMGVKKIIHGLSSLGDIVETDCNTLIDAVGDEILREDDINDDISKHKNIIKGIDTSLLLCALLMISNPDISAAVSNTVNTLRHSKEVELNVINVLENKIRKIDEIEAATKDLFLEYGNLISLMNTGLSALATSTANGFNLPANQNWIKEIDEAINTATAKALENAKGKYDITHAFSKDPVNLSSGNFIYEKNDLVIDGKSPLVFGRFYNSINTYKGAFGNRWNHSFEVKLLIERNVAGKESAKIIREDGREESFTFIGDEGVVNFGASLGKLMKSSSGYVYETEAGTKYIFNFKGQYIKRKDKNRTSIDLSYEDGLLVSIRKSSGEGYVLEYNAERMIDAVTDHTGRTVKYEYEKGALSKAIMPNGGAYKYLYDSRGYLSEIVNADNVSTITNKYDSYGRVISQTFPDESSMSYKYDDDRGRTVQTERNGAVSYHYNDSRLRTIKNEYCDAEECFSYNKKDKRTAFVDKNGGRREFLYNENGDVIKVIDPVGTETIIEYDSKGKPEKLVVDGKLKVKNEYSIFGERLIVTEDGLGRKTFFRHDKNGNVCEIMNAEGSITSFSFDERDNVVEVCDERGGKQTYEWDAINRLTGTIDANGNARQITYDDDSNITAVVQPDKSSITFEYDKLGRMIKETAPNGAETTYKYNCLGFPSEKTDPLGRITTYTYDEMWNLKEEILPNGGCISYEYDKNNRLILQIDPEGGRHAYAYDGMGNLIMETDEVGNVTEYEYNGINRLTSARYPDGSEENFCYDGSENIIKYTDRGGNEYSFIYDAADQLIEEIDPLGNSKKYEYTPIGRIASRTDSSGCTTRYEYYPGGVLKRIIHPDGASEDFVVDPAGNITEYSDVNNYKRYYKYDCINRLIEVKGENGERTAYTYDAMNNVTSKINADGGKSLYEYSLSGMLIKVTDELGNEVEYDYDDMDQITEVRRISKGENVSRVMKYVRDLMGRVTKSINPIGDTTSFKYDAKGRLIEKTDRDGFVTKTKYNSLDKITEILYADGNFARFAYDSLGKTTKTETPNGASLIEYDCLGKMTKETYPDGQVVSYGYGKSGERTSITYPDGSTAHYRYDNKHRLAEIMDGESSILYHYDELNRLARRAMPNGSSTSYEYDNIGRLQMLTHANDKGIIDRQRYEYDMRGNVSCIEKERRESSEHSGSFNYKYDVAGKLIEVAKDSKVLREYQYDAFGNRMRKTSDGIETIYSYNEADQLISKREAESETTYTYDRRGNITTMCVDGNTSKRFVYGAANRLDKVIDSSGLASEYIYDAAGQRVKEIIGNVETEYIVDHSKEHSNLVQRKRNGMNQRFIWEDSIPLAIKGDEEYYYLADMQGTPMHLMSADNALIESYAYDEFGNELSGMDRESIQPFAYTGYRKDVVSGTYFAQAREYMPDAGRFAGEDIVSGSITKPLAMNPYNYCLASPLIMVDRNGAFPIVETVVDGTFDFLGWTGILQGNPEGKNWLLSKSRELAETPIPGFSSTNASDYAAALSKSRIGEQAIGVTLNMDRDSNGVYHARRNCIQRHFGYNDTYDHVFKSFTSANPNKLPVFSYNGEDYQIWMWKGDYYGLGAGAETGIYRGSGYHKLTYQDSNLIMKLSLYDKSGKQIMKYEPGDPQWWITGFNPEYQDVKYQDLRVEGMIDFSKEPGLWEAFIKEFQSIDDDSLCIDVENKILYYKW